jgi:hypothetical protein
LTKPCTGHSKTLGSKMRLIIIFMTTFAISACLPLKQSSYLASFVKEKPLSTLPEVRDVQVSGDRKTIKVENRAVVPYFEVIFHDMSR